VDENDQGSDVDSSSTSKGPVPIGRPEECPAHFSELESPCQVLSINFLNLKTRVDNDIEVVRCPALKLI